MNSLELLKSKNGNYTLVRNDIYIYSKYDPIKEVKRFWDNNKDLYKDKKSIVIYGLGLGYHVEELLNRVESSFKIYVFDVDSSVYDICIEKKLYKKILNKENVKINIGYSSENMKRLSVLINDSENFISIPSIVKSLNNEYRNLKEIIENFNISKISLEKFSYMMEISLKENKKINYYDIEEFIDKNKCEKPIVLVASGPSLNNKSIETLKKIRDKIKIFTVGRSLKALIESGINPDMLCIIDCQDLVYDHIRGYENTSIPMTFLSTANNKAVSRYNGPRYIFYNEDNGQKYIIETGKSVATAILDIAIKCNSKKIIFVGQDLAYINGNFHGEKATFEDESTVVSGITTVKGINGENLKTTKGLMYFKTWIENRISREKDIKFINCSLGADIKGTVVVDISELKDIL